MPHAGEQTGGEQKNDCVFDLLKYMFPLSFVDALLRPSTTHVFLHRLERP